MNANKKIIDGKKKEEELDSKNVLDAANLHYIYKNPEILSLENHLKINEMLNKVEQEKKMEKFNKIKIDEDTVNNTIKRMESERNSKIFIKLKRKNLFVFDIKNSKNNFKNTKLLTSQIKTPNEIIGLVANLEKNEKDYGLNLKENSISFHL